MNSGEPVFEHRSRRKLYDYIYTNPGVSFGTLKNLFDMNKSTLKYHLNFLEKENKIESKREGRRRLYYCSDQPVIKRNGVHPAQKPLTVKQQRLLALIKQSPGISNKQLNFESRLTPKAVEYNLNRLMEMKIIWRVKTGNGIGYEYISKEKLYREMHLRLLKKLLTEEIDEETFHRIKQKLKDIDLAELEDRV